MNVIIAGSRSIANYSLVCKAIALSGFSVTHVTSGGARGVDTLAIKWANENNIPCTVVPANWAGYGKQAGILRNMQMARSADALVAVWNNESPGTKHMIECMSRMGKPVYIYPKENSSVPRTQ